MVGILCDENSCILGFWTGCAVWATVCEFQGFGRHFWLLPFSVLACVRHYGEWRRLGDFEGRLDGDRHSSRFGAASPEITKDQADNFQEADSHQPVNTISSVYSAKYYLNFSN